MKHKKLIGFGIGIATLISIILIIRKWRNSSTQKTAREEKALEQSKTDSDYSDALAPVKKNSVPIAEWELTNSVIPRDFEDMVDLDLQTQISQVHYITDDTIKAAIIYRMNQIKGMNALNSSYFINTVQYLTAIRRLEIRAQNLPSYQTLFEGMALQIKIFHEVLRANMGAWEQKYGG